ncbi:MULTISPECIES: SDR family oxidoreductase [unclassified Amycolatopsis]|uniref:SDR family oxidoreductase n=1 Tax=unclassified Amycolatopsis TaxID=2618356 RepID=UPI0004856378|nr:SDR family oxidoreductase [Amycolatopsis sp. ATCC 39116]
MNVRGTAVVVGATGGIGAEVAAALADRYTVWVAGRDETALKELAGTLPDAHCWTVDLAADPDISDNCPELSSVDVVVHCAGVFQLGSVADTDLDVWRELFAVNLFGVIGTTRRLLPALRAARGRVILVNSTAVLGSPAHRSAYAASKTALRVFAEALRREELPNGVRVTSIYPGRVATPMQQTVRRMEGGPYEPERYLDPASIADAVRSVLDAPPNTHPTELVIEPEWRP